jgi:hypothetical protein
VTLKVTKSVTLKVTKSVTKDQQVTALVAESAVPKDTRYTLKYSSLGWLLIFRSVRGIMLEQGLKGSVV